MTAADSHDNEVHTSFSGESQDFLIGPALRDDDLQAASTVIGNQFGQASAASAHGLASIAVDVESGHLVERGRNVNHVQRGDGGFRLARQIACARQRGERVAGEIHRTQDSRERAVARFTHARGTSRNNHHRTSRRTKHLLCE